MNTRENIVIISAELKGLDKHINFERTTELRNKLLDLGLQFNGVTLQTDESSQYSFLVLTSQLATMLELAQIFGQNNIIFSDSQRQTSVHNITGTDTVFLGTLKSVEKHVALNKKPYIIVTEDGKEHYYSAV